MKKKCFELLVMGLLSILFAAAFEIVKLPIMAIGFLVVAAICFSVSAALFMKKDK